MNKILECSSKGDIRFSAFFAKVNVFGKTNTIENHYQLSKRFIQNDGKVFIPQKVKDSKGKKVNYFEINGMKFSATHLSAFYSLLWVKYLDSNPDLVKHASEFDDFSDVFKGKSINCQADIIRKYIKEEGRSSIMDDKKIQIFLDLLSAHENSKIN